MKRDGGTGDSINLFGRAQEELLEVIQIDDNNVSIGPTIKFGKWDKSNARMLSEIDAIINEIQTERKMLLGCRYNLDVFIWNGIRTAAWQKNALYKYEHSRKYIGNYSSFVHASCFESGTLNVQHGRVSKMTYIK